MMVKTGDRIELVLMEDDPCPIPAGARGTVLWQTDLSCMGGHYKGQSQIAVNWDNGRSLSLITPKDKFKIIEENAA